MCPCSECSREATLFCATCDLHWCQHCSDHVHSMRAFKSHTPIAIPNDAIQPQPQQQSHPLSELGCRWFSRSCPLPTAASPRAPRPVLIVVDWHSFVWVVRRTSLGMFVRTLAHLAHDLGHISVTKLLFLMDSHPSTPEPNPRAKEIAADMSAFFIEQMQLVWETTSGGEAAQQPSLMVHKMKELIQRTDSFIPDSLTIFASSRPHRFRPLLDTYLRQGRQLVLVYGQDKAPHSLPAKRLAPYQRPPDIAHLGMDVSTTMGAHSVPDPAALSPYLDRTLTTALALICATWPDDSSSQSGGMTLASTLGQHLSQLVGVHCLWDLPPWHESYEQSSAGESRVLPMHGCPLWNAQLPCGNSFGTLCTQPHHCQACGQAHPLMHCPVNSFLPIPSETLAKRSDISLADRSAFMRWYGDVYALLKFRSSFHVWKLPLIDQLARAQLLILPSGVLQSSHDANTTHGLIPCDALIYIDWQNIKVPLYAVRSLMDGLHRFVLKERPGVRTIRAVYVLLDRSKMSDIADALDALAHESAIPIHVEHVEARKFQAIDSRLTLMLRTGPRTAVADRSEADLVCVVSGDSDYSPDMSRLVLLGHRVLVVYNSQARPSFKQNALWEGGVDFMDLPELASYRAAQLLRRQERKHALHSAQQLGVTMYVSTMTVHGGDLQSRLPGLHGACMDSEGHALLVTDEVQNQLWRFALPGSSSNASMVGLDRHICRPPLLKHTIKIKSSCAESSVGVLRDLHRDLHTGSLELLIKSKRCIHFIVCIDNGETMETYWPCVMVAMEGLKQRLRSSSSEEAQKQPTSDLMSLFVFHASTAALQDQPVPVNNISLTGLPTTHTAVRSNLLTLLVQLKQVIAQCHAPVIELLFITEPMLVSESSADILASLMEISHDHTNSALNCTVICPRVVLGTTARDAQEEAHKFEVTFQGIMGRRATFIHPSNSSAQTIDTSVQQFLDAVAGRHCAQSEFFSAGAGCSVGVRAPLHLQLNAPKEVVVDRDSGLVFVCEGGDGRIVVLDRKTNCMRTLQPQPACGVMSRLMQPAPQARHLFIDSSRQRLWLTNIYNGEMGYYDLQLRSVVDDTHMMVPYRVAQFESTLPSASRPTSKCLAANGVDMVYCDEGRRAFFVLTEIKQQKKQQSQTPTPMSVKSPVTFRSTLLFDWTVDNVTPLHSSAPLPSYHSLQLDRDGSYLFADATSHTIKRLVALRDLDDGDNGADSWRWEVHLVAGKGQGGLADGESREARFKFPATLVVDHSEAGSVFIVDQGNRLLRKLHVVHDCSTGGAGGSSSRNSSSCDIRNSSSSTNRGFVANASIHRTKPGLTNGVSDTARSRLKTRPCRHFQRGECYYQAESDKCGFIHECACCGGPHGERVCLYKPQCDPLGDTVQHINSDAHRDRFIQPRHSGLSKTIHTPESDQMDLAHNSSTTRTHNPDSPLHIRLVGHTENDPLPAGALCSGDATRVDALSSAVVSTVVPSSSSSKSLALTDSVSLDTSSGASIRFRCELCSMEFNSGLQMEQHAKGRMHRNRSVRAAAGISLCTPSDCPDSSPTRGELHAPPFSCHVCVDQLQTEVVAGSVDRRPRGLPCGHIVCLSCMLTIDEKCPLCTKPFELAQIDVNVHAIETMQAHVRAKAEAQRKRVQSERMMQEQHDAFQRAYPCMKRQLRHPKEPIYFCETCQSIAGPLHRALAHANTNDHKAKLPHQPHQHQIVKSQNIQSK